MITYHINATKVEQTYNPKTGSVDETIGPVTLILTTCYRCDCFLRVTDARHFYHQLYCNTCFDTVQQEEQARRD